jgi:hypothetical protein
LENSSKRPDSEPIDLGGRVPQDFHRNGESMENVDFANLLLTVKRFEEYLIVNSIDSQNQNGLLFSEGSSSFLFWLTETYRRRALRSKYFNNDYFSGEGAWNILLDLAASRIKGKRISVTSACLASGVPPTTALRWIALLEQDGMVEKEIDYADRRRTFLRISDDGMKLLHKYYSDLHSHSAIPRRKFT